MAVAASDQVALANTKSALSAKFRMKDLGELSWFLGMQFVREKDCVNVNQSWCMEKMLRQFNMDLCKPRFTPCKSDINQISSETSEEMADPQLYRSIVGSLIYVMTFTRPDLSYRYSLVSAFGETDQCISQCRETCPSLHKGDNSRKPDEQRKLTHLLEDQEATNGGALDV